MADLPGFVEDPRSPLPGYHEAIDPCWSEKLYRKRWLVAITKRYGDGFTNLEVLGRMDRLVDEKQVKSYLFIEWGPTHNMVELFIECGVRKRAKAMAHLLMLYNGKGIGDPDGRI